MPHKSHPFREKPIKKEGRKRFLNIIYFIDSRRTRTLKFSIHTSYSIVALLALSLTWSVVSSLLLLRDHLVIADLKNHSRELLQLVFNYQTRYDEVYEKAYPERTDPNSAKTSDAGLANVEDSESENDEPDKEKVSSQSIAAKVEMKLAAKNTPIQVAKAVKANEKSTPIDGISIGIDNFSSQMQDNRMTIRLSLKNLKSPERSSGILKARARFLTKENEYINLDSNPSTGYDEQTDQHFNIRYFKNKSFSFESPQDQSGQFTSVTIQISDDQKHTQDFVFPLNNEPIALPGSNQDLLPPLAKSVESEEGP